MSVLLLPCAFGRSGPTIVCAQCGTEVWSCDPGPLDQERDRSPHEPGQLSRHGLASVSVKPHYHICSPSSVRLFLFVVVIVESLAGLSCVETGTNNKFM